MLSQVKKIMDPTGRKQVAGQLGAWWDGREYEPEAEGEVEVEAGAGEDGDAAPDDAADKASPARPAIGPADPATDGARITALERMWGTGRLGPAALDNEILDRLEVSLLADGDIGMMGADPALLDAWMQRSSRNLFASEWRAGALERVRRAAPDVTVINDDIDRAKAFPDDALAALASVNTMAYADHKAGLVSRAFHALKDGGRWVVLDTVRTTAKTPPHAFASAWAEPQLLAEEEFDALLEKCGFGEVSKQNMTPQMIACARTQMNELGAALEATVSEGMSGPEGVLFLRELVWELKSWRARLKALEGGALQVVMWSAVKGGAPGLVEAPVSDEPGATAPAGGEDETSAAAGTATPAEALADETDPAAEDSADLDAALFGEDD